MARRKLTDNEIAAILAGVAGVLFLFVGWNGAQAVEEFVQLLVDVFGSNPALRILAYVLIAIASLGGIAVITGAVLISMDRVRWGEFLVLLGAGAGIFTLVLFLVLLVRRPAALGAHLGAIPVLVGVALSIAARMKAKPVVKG